MISTLTLIAVLAAPGDIYRCPTTDGSVRYQELPCAGTAQHKLAAKDVSSQAKLRQWLDELRSTVPPPSAGSSEPAPRSRPARPPAPSWSGTVALPARPGSEQALASCSALFLQCADSSAERMDRCVAGISQCTGRAGACCHPSFIQRYQLLRDDGAPLKLAVRDALLGE